MFNNNYVPDLVLENCRIIRRNFRGAQNEYNREGDRNFCVVINEEYVEELIAQGWNIKTLPPREGVEGSQPLNIMKVNVVMDSSRPPMIYVVTSKKKTLMDEESVATIDSAEITNVDLVIHPGFWHQPSGKSGIKAYVKSMYITIAEDPFCDKYVDFPSDSEEPF